ncbi:MAG: hypothetical protein ACTSU5_22275 [Promethearchaeota archaeon]
MPLRGLVAIVSNGDSSGELLGLGMGGSGFADGSLITGFISAFRQFGREMVTEESQVSNSSWENQAGGSKRLIFHTTWGKEVSRGVPGAPQLPEISTICQVGGPALGDQEYAMIESLISHLNDEVLYRMMVGEVFPDRSVEPWVAVDILDSVLSRFPAKSRNRILGKVQTEGTALEQVVSEKLDEVFSENQKILSKFLERVPLGASCDQAEYERTIASLQDYVEGEIREFYEAEEFLERARKKIRGPGNNLVQIREEYGRFQDKQLSYIQNRNALSLSLEAPRLLFSELRRDLRNYAGQEPVKGLLELGNILPRPDEVEELMSRIQENPAELEKYGTIASFDFDRVTRFLEQKGVDNGTTSKITVLGENLAGVVELLRRIASLSEGTENRLLNLQGSYLLLCSEDALSEEAKPGDASIQDIQALLEDEPEHQQIDDTPVAKAGGGVPNPGDELEAVIHTLRSNLVHQVIAALYEKVFNEYAFLKYVVVYGGNLKKTVLAKVLDAIRRFTARIQDFSFAALFERTLKGIRGNTGGLEPVQRYAIFLLLSYLHPFLRRHFKNDPFLIDHENPVIAIDTYSRQFCAEIIKGVGLEGAFYEQAEALPLPRRYVESFIQAFDAAGLTRESVIRELRGAGGTFQSWVGQVDQQISELGSAVSRFDPRKIVDYCRKTLLVDPGKYQTREMVEKVKWRNEFVKRVVFQGEESDARVLALYSSLGNVRKILESIEGLTRGLTGKNLQDFYRLRFSKSQYTTLLSDFKALLGSLLLREREKVKGFLESHEEFTSEVSAPRVDEILDSIGSVEDLVDPAKLAAFKARIRDVTGGDVLDKLLNRLEEIDNDALNLKNFAHFKGILRNVTRPPDTRESPVQKKAQAQQHLMEALIQTYSVAYEDYFGRIVPDDQGNGAPQSGRGGSRRSKGTSKVPAITLEPGRTFENRYCLAKEHLKLMFGLRALGNLLATTTSGGLKSKTFRLAYAMNYLPAYMEDRGFTSSVEMLQAFSGPAEARDFLTGFLVEKVRERKGKIKEQVRKLFEGTRDFVTGRSKVKPAAPSFEVKMLAFESFTNLLKVLELATPRDKIYYRDGKNSPKGHPSRDHNLKKVARRIEGDLERLDDLDARIEEDVRDLLKNYKYVPPGIPSLETLLGAAVAELRSRLEGLTFLPDLDLEAVTKVRVSSFLDSQRYVVPQEVTLKLVNEGKLNRRYIDGVVHTSMKVGEIYQHVLSGVLGRDETFSQVLTKEVKNNGKNGRGPDKYLSLLIKVPEALTEGTLGKVFGPGAVWTEEGEAGRKLAVRGYKLLFDARDLDGEDFGTVLSAKVTEEALDELEPVLEFLNQYSRNVHSGFDRVYESLFRPAPP